MAFTAFSKYEGCGNDFIIIDNRTPLFIHWNPESIQQLCHRQRGIGADGLILLEGSQHADFRMRIYNADGNEAEMCGNGGRCLIKFIQELGIIQNLYQIETMHKSFTASVKDNDLICITMGEASDIKLGFCLEVDNQCHTVHYMDTGVPHLILFSSDSDKFPLATLGTKFRHHPHFGSKGTNFNVATITPDGEILNRTFERGVEGETMACGTGCTAVALAAAQLYQLPSPIIVHNQAGQLEIAFEVLNGDLHNVTMTGPANRTFKGHFDSHSFSLQCSCPQHLNSQG